MKKKSKKAQVSMEVMTLGAIMTLALVIATVIFVNQYYDVSKKKEVETLNLVSQKIKSELELAKNAEPGYYRSFNIPSKINGKEVKVELYVSKEGNFSEVRLKFDPPISEYIESTAIIGEAVFGSVNAGENKIMKNEEGVIIIPKVLPENVKMNVSYVKIKTNNTKRILTLKDGFKCDFFIENYDPNKDLQAKTEYKAEIPSEEGTQNIILSSTPTNIKIDTNGYPKENYHDFSIFNLDNTIYNTLPEGSNISCKVTITESGKTENYTSENKLTLQDTITEIKVLEARSDDITDPMNSKAIITINASDIDYYDNTFKVDFISSYLDCNNNTRIKEGGFNSCTNNDINNNEKKTFKLPLNINLQGFNSLETIPIIIQVTNKDNQEEIAKKEINIELKSMTGHQG